MKLELLFLGKTRESYLAAGIKDYHKRLSHYTRVELITIKEERLGKGVSEKVLVDKQSRRLLQHVQGACLVCLDGSGRQLDSLELSARMHAWEMQGLKKISFVLGGPLGLSAEILKNADFVLSLSKMTFTHEMARLILLEQLYRASTIRAGEKYHK